MSNVIPIVPAHYCSNKFTFLKVDLEKQASLNCHAAAEHRINLSWLKENPGQLFNTPINIAEREQMLRGERNASCEKNCYPAEDKNEVSTRMIENNNSLHNVYTTPKMVDITLSSDCNMSCSYCCKEYSRTWRDDLIHNGPYIIDGFIDAERYSVTTRDQVVSKLTQTQKLTSSATKLLLTEINALGMERVIITGGESFLNKHLLDVVDHVKHVPDVKIFTGLGVNKLRFARILKLLTQYKNVRFAVSGENIGTLHEFNRHGCSWETWKSNLDLLKSLDANVTIHAVVSNLTLPGFAEFYREFKDVFPFEIDVVHSPDFMSPGNLDPATKDKIIKVLDNFNNPTLKKIISTLSITKNTDLHRKQMGQWLLQYVQRRNVDITVLPQTFREWLFK
jgi:organic radical activating enzyme